jgi:FkbM family methyltransferase
MKSIISLGIRLLRRCFYNTPIKHWRVTALLYAFVGRLLIGKEPYPVIEVDGMKLKTNGDDVIVTAALVNGNYEPYTLDVFRSLLREVVGKAHGPVVFCDVGANIGLFSVVAARIDSSIEVFAFEPNTTSYRLLQDNIALNGLVRITPVSAAVGEASGKASLDISSANAGMHSIFGTGTKRHEVTVVSLDDFFAERGTQPGLIKVDVEGYEPLVLRGMKRLLQDGPMQIILEFNPELLKLGGKEPSEFLHELTEHFDRIYCLDEIERKPLPYRPGDHALEHKLDSVGYNLLLIKGDVPPCLEGQPPA